MKPQGEKIHKILADLGYGSRRGIENLIVQGKVKVNNQVVKIGERMTLPENCKIELDGKIFYLNQENKTKSKTRVLIYYKPEGEVVSRAKDLEWVSVFDKLLRIHQSRWIAVGRLDVNTSGLLLFTNDGKLANTLMHPSNEVEREYSVRIFGEVTEEMLKNLKKGVMLEDGLAQFSKITFQGGQGLNQWFNVVIKEGRNREVRRLWETQGVQVSRLIRIRYGNVVLPPSLSRGRTLELTAEQIQALYKLVNL